MELNELRKTAEAATHGPWEKHDLPVAVANSNFTIHAPNAVGIPTWTTALPPEIASTLKTEDAEHVATFNPETVLALLSRLEQAEQALEATERQVVARSGETAAERIWRIRAEQAEQQVARVREVLSEWDTDEDSKGLHFDIERALDGDGRG